MKRELHYGSTALFCIFEFPDTGVQIPCYFGPNEMQWLLKTALPSGVFVGRIR
jgi:hypothetical protein